MNNLINILFKDDIYKELSNSYQKANEFIKQMQLKIALLEANNVVNDRVI